MFDSVLDVYNGFGDLVLGVADQPGGGSGGGAVSETTGQEFATAIRNFIGPIVLLIIGLVAVSFLFKRQLTQFFQFMALAVLAGIFFYTPNLVENIATWLGGLFGGTSAT